MKTTILTAIYGDYDTLKSIVPQSIECDWVCVTDDVLTPKELNGWKTYYEPRPWLHPNRAAKTPKMLPWLYTDTSSSIWIDASFQVLSPTFAEEALSYADPIAQFKHPWRNCVYAEARESMMLSKYHGQPLDQQVYHLLEEGHPEGWGLWATGVIARHHTTNVVKMGTDWLAEVHMYSYQDQISHPDVCRRNGIRPTNFPGSYFAGPWVAYEGSGRH